MIQTVTARVPPGKRVPMPAGSRRVAGAHLGVPVQKMVRPSVTEANLEERLAELARLPTPKLRVEWAVEYGSPAPRRIGRDLLLRAIAYRIQEKLFGGLKASTKRRLLAIAADLKAGKTVQAKARPRLQQGTQLMREWNGRTERVEVLAKGYSWNGAVYRSLTMVARAITGTHWSGPRFFGLDSEQKS